MIIAGRRPPDGAKEEEQVKLRKRIVWLVMALAAVAALGVAGCGGSDDSSSSSASKSNGGVQSSITIASNNPNYATQAPFVMAQELGYFKDVGIDNIKIVTTDNFVQGLVGGSVDISQGDTDEFLNAAYKSTKPISIVACFRNSEYWQLGVSKDIASVKQLEGKTATGGANGSRNEFIMKLIFKQLGVDPNKVHDINMSGGSDARLQGLLNGQVQGAMIQPRHIKPLEDAGGKVVYNKQFKVPQEMLTVRSDWLQENHATLTAFLTALIKANKYVLDPSHKDEIIKVMKEKKYEISQADLDSYDITNSTLSKTLGFKPSGMDELVQQEQQINLMPKDMDWHKFVDFSDLYKAQKADGVPKSPPPA
jgi:ABC-type nitrate/sulfonate/bicarbonate transport system substrate-binding protein